MNLRPGGAGRRAMNMKTNQAELDQALQGWRVTSPLPPRFRERVWQRIERAEAPRRSLFDAWREWFSAAFARPVYAVAYVSLLLVAGLTIGFFQASEKVARWDRQLEARYVQSIDPYQKSQ
jgi:hypothetical protein